MKHRVAGNPTPWRILAAVVGGGAAVLPWSSSLDGPDAATANSESFLKADLTPNVRPWDMVQRLQSHPTTPHRIWSFSSLSSTTWMEASTSCSSASTTKPPTTQRRAVIPKETKVYDFCVIGYGTAGQQAVETLRNQCPSATICLVDPLLVQNKSSAGRMDEYASHAVGLDPRERRVTLEENTVIAYKHAVLLATGARGAPPPHYLLDSKGRDLITELRATVLGRQTTPHEVRQRALAVAVKGGRVCVLGSGWEAMDLAVAAISKAPTQAKPVVIFGSSGPMSHVLPSYLSTAVAKRLRKKMQVLDRTLVRYISYDDHDKAPCLQVYTAKSYDFLDSQRTTADLVVIAPETSGARGSAALCTWNVPSHLRESQEQRSWYEPWSLLAMPMVQDPSTIVCYKDDGRVAVNTELCACTGVYAAGSVAKFGNGLTGHADVAGIGVEDGAEGGRMAATNMSRLYHATKLFQGTTTSYPMVKDPIPVWRSDLRSSSSSSLREKTSLADIGISALCVGNCDSERFATHGIWWTNATAYRRRMTTLKDEGVAKPDRRRMLKESLKPVYGLGVVYYHDKSGKIQGIMTWGLPFTSDGDQLNESLVESMKGILRSNGGFSSLGSELDYQRMSNYLATVSRDLVATAFSGSAKDGHAHRLNGHVDSFPRPYHRYTDVRPPGVRLNSVLKRKDGQAHGVLGEDLFARFEDVVISTPPKPLAANSVGYAAAKAQAMYDWNVWEAREKQWDENESRARPPKEDLLWIRKGDEARSVSARETLQANYNAAIWKRS